MSDSVESVLEIAVRSCGLKELKPKQREALLAFIDHRDVFVALPTGYGKSIIYGILPVVFDILKGKDFIISLNIMISCCCRLSR